MSNDYQARLLAALQAENIDPNDVKDLQGYANAMSGASSAPTQQQAQSPVASAAQSAGMAVPVASGDYRDRLVASLKGQPAVPPELQKAVDSAAAEPSYADRVAASLKAAGIDPNAARDLQGYADSMSTPGGFSSSPKQKPAPKGWENSGGAWEVDDDGVERFYAPVSHVNDKGKNDSQPQAQNMMEWIKNHPDEAKKMPPPQPTPPEPQKLAANMVERHGGSGRGYGSEPFVNPAPINPPPPPQPTLPQPPGPNPPRATAALDAEDEKKKNGGAEFIASPGGFAGGMAAGLPVPILVPSSNGPQNPLALVGGPITGLPSARAADNAGALPDAKNQAAPLVVDARKPIAPSNWNAQTDAALRGSGATVTPRTDLADEKPTGPGVGFDAGNAVPTAMSPARFANIPAHEVALIDPERQKVMAQDVGAEGQALSNEAKVQGQTASMVGDELTKVGDQQKRDVIDAENREQTRQSVLSRFGDEVHRRATEIASSKIDPFHYWKERGAVGAVANIIALTLGGFGAGMRGGQNQVMESIDKAVDRDIAAQREQISNKKSGLETIQNQFDQYRHQFGDDRTAEAAMRVDRLSGMKAYIESLKEKRKDPEFQARANIQIAQLNTQLSKNLATMNHWVPQQTVQVGGAGAGGVTEKNKPLIFTGADGRDYQARDAESRKKLAKASASVTQVDAALTDYQRALKQVGPWDRAQAKLGIHTPNMLAAQSARNAALIPMREAGDEGVWRKGEVGLYEEQLLGPESFTGDPSNQIAQARRNVKNIYNSTLIAEKPIPVETGYTRGARGEVEPTAGYTGSNPQKLAGTGAPPANTGFVESK